MRILLGREGVDPKKPDNDGRTPLRLVIKNRVERVVVLLQSRKAATI